MHSTSPLLRSLLVGLLLAGGSASAARAQLPAPAGPQNPLQRHGIGEADPRVRIDLREEPWRALGKLQVAVGDRHTSCTGALIGPKTVLTAAHCVVNPRTGGYHLPASLHFLIGFDRGDYAIHARVLNVSVPSDYDPRRPRETLGSDWAVLTLDLMHGTDERILPMLSSVPQSGTAVMIGGYSQDQPLTLTADVACRIVGQVRDVAGKRLLRHDCTATRGTSGAPVLVQQGSAWYVGGINVAAPRGEAGGLAVPLDEPRRH